MLTGLPNGFDVAAFLGRGGDDTVVEAGHQSTVIIVAMARSYTRGAGFDGGLVADDLAAVITTSAARLVSNPAQYSREQTGDWSAVGGFAGWTLAELFVLNAYRKRTG